MATRSQLDELKELIAIRLDTCDSIDWPYICHMSATPEGRASLEKKIIEQCSVSGCSVGQAINRIERMYNPNRMED